MKEYYMKRLMTELAHNRNRIIKLNGAYEGDFMTLSDFSDGDPPLVRVYKVLLRDVSEEERREDARSIILAMWQWGELLELRYYHNDEECRFTIKPTTIVCYRYKIYECAMSYLLPCEDSTKCELACRLKKIYDWAYKKREYEERAREWVKNRKISE